MTNQPWARLLLLSLGLAGCGLDVSQPSGGTQGPTPAALATRRVLGAPASDVEDRIAYIIEARGIGATDFYPTVLALQVTPIAPGGLYWFEADARVSTLAGPVPRHFTGTYLAPSDTLVYSSGVPSFALGQPFSGRGRGFLWQADQRPHVR
jgi:hypothetical protein